ncbi:MAG: DUF3037 domain-containing protein [Acidobacteria bacterium]|nr:DUF3037 domain-containing protein [Acidobacteriota bacterium]
MSDKQCTFDYAVFRFVPRVELEEFFNVGVIVSCPAFTFLDALVAVNEEKLRCFAPDTPLDEVKEYLAIIPQICAGTGSDTISKMPQRERFYWLTAQRSTIIQSSPVHTGLTSDPAATLKALFKKYVH